MKTQTWFLFFIAVIFALTSCHNQNNRPPQTSFKPIRVGIKTRIEKIDYQSKFFSLIRDGLAEMNKDSQSLPSPKLVESWKWETPLHLKLFLKKDIKWPDGREFTSDELRESWRDVLLDAEAPRELLFAISKAQLFSKSQVSYKAVGIRSSEKYTLELHFQTPDPTFIQKLTHPILRPDPLSHSVKNGLGPYFYKKLSNNHDSFISNPLYAFGKNPIHGIDVITVPSDEERIQMLQNGELDLIDDLPDFYFAYVTKDPRVITAQLPTLIGITVSHRIFPLDNVKIRELLHQTVNRSELVSHLNLPFSIAKEWLPWGSRSIAIDENPEDTLSIFQRLYSEKFKKESFKLNLSVQLFKHSSQLAEGIRAQWMKRLPIQVEFVSPEEAHASLVEVPISYYNRMKGFEYFFGSKWGQWRTMKFNELFFAAQENETINQLDDTLSELEKLMIQKEMTFIPLLFRNAWILKNPKLKGSIFARDGSFDLREASLS